MGICLSIFAGKPKFIQKIERIDGILYLIDEERKFKVDTTVLTVKKKYPEKPTKIDIEVLAETKLRNL